MSPYLDTVTLCAARLCDDYNGDPATFLSSDMELDDVNSSTYWNFTDGNMTHTKTNISCNNCTDPNSALDNKSPQANIFIPIATSLLGVIGNAIAIYTVRNSRREHHRTVFFVLVGGLAWTDLIGIILTTIPVLIVYGHGEWVGGEPMCNYHGFFMITFGMITPLVVCAMAIERYIGIRHGYFYTRHFNTSRARLLLLVLWLVTVIYSAFPLFGFGSYERQWPGTWCFLNIHPITDRGITAQRINAAYSCLFAVINLLLIFVIVVCNIVVQGTLIVMRVRRTRMSSPSHFRRTHRSRKQQELEIQMVILLLAITIVFTCCWAPLMAQILKNHISYHLTPEDHKEDLTSVRLASINQVLDPWVYILCRKVIQSFQERRQARIFFTRLWGCWRHIFLGKRTGSQRSITHGVGGAIVPLYKRQGTASNLHGYSAASTRRGAGTPISTPISTPIDSTTIHPLRIYPAAEQENQNAAYVIPDRETTKLMIPPCAKLDTIPSEDAPEISEMDMSFRDSGTSSIDERSRVPTTPSSPRVSTSTKNTSSSHQILCTPPGSSASVSTKENGDTAPIPIFSTSRYCIRKGSRRSPRERSPTRTEIIGVPRERRAVSSSSDTTADLLSISKSIKANHQCPSLCESVFLKDSSPRKSSLKLLNTNCRRHSWGYLEDGFSYKHVKTTSTQTITYDRSKSTGSPAVE